MSNDKSAAPPKTTTEIARAEGFSEEFIATADGMGKLAVSLLNAQGFLMSALLTQLMKRNSIAESEVREMLDDIRHNVDYGDDKLLKGMLDGLAERIDENVLNPLKEGN